MVLILLSWFVALFCFISSGMLFSKIINLKSQDVMIIVFFGVFFQCIFLSITAFFTNLGIEVFCANLFFCLVAFVYQKNEFKTVFNKSIASFKNLSSYTKIILLLILLASLYKCSLAPFLIDNESYYIQTIKWINEYGFVKGLANLHIFFAQTSPLHVLQAGFNFNFLTNNINDINGLIFLVSSWFFVEKMEYQYSENNKFHWVGLLFVLNVIYFQFIPQPSPDFIIIIVSQIVFYLFIENNKDANALKSSIILFLLMVFIKITVAPLGLLLLIWIFIKKRFLSFFVGFGVLILLILIFKNAIISGYPFYPFQFYSLNFDWTIPENLFLFITESSKNTGYFEGEIVVNPTLYQKICAWLHLSGLNRIFNLGILLLFFLTLFTVTFRTNKLYRILYLSLLIHFIVLLLTSPQFRFFLPEFIFLTVLILSTLFNYFKIKFKLFQLLYLLFLFSSLVLIEYLDFKNISDNKYLQTKSIFKINNLIVPDSNSKYDYLKFELVKNGNLYYFSPKENFFFYGTADGNLPCVNKVQIDYLEKYYYIKPQLRTSNISDGFYSKITKQSDE